MRAKQLSIVLVCTPFATLVMEWLDSGLFARLFSPFLHRLELVSWIPKLSRDLDEIAYRHFHYPPDPYLYWYAYTLVLVSLIALFAVFIFWREMGPDGWRFRAGLQLNDRLVRSRREQIGALLGGLMFLLWPWFGLSMLGTTGRSLPPGWAHDIFMALCLVMYGATLAAGPALIKFVVLRRRSLRQRWFDE
ncbi:MAG: hypothetical protein ACPGFA_01735 [Pikeienuella sp.]